MSIGAGETRPPTPAGTRRRPTMTGLALAVALALAVGACGSDDDPAPSASAEGSAAPTSSASRCAVTLAEVQALLPPTSGVTENATPDTGRCNFTWDDNGPRGIDVAIVRGGRSSFDIPSGYEPLDGYGDEAFVSTRASRASAFAFVGDDLYAADVVADGAGATEADLRDLCLQLLEPPSTDRRRLRLTRSRQRERRDRPVPANTRKDNDASPSTVVRRLRFFRFVVRCSPREGNALMTASTLERTVLPPTESLDDLVAMLSRPDAEPATTLSGPNGEQLMLPPEVFAVLRDVVEAMAHGQAVTIAPVHQRLTTQEAADLLGVSRPTLVKLLESGEIPFEQPGRHRRVRLADVLAYRERASEARRAALDRMVEMADEADLYELTAIPKRAR